MAATFFTYCYIESAIYLDELIVLLFRFVFFYGVEKKNFIAWSQWPMIWCFYIHSEIPIPLLLPLLVQWQQKQTADKGQSHNHAYHVDVSSNFFLPHMLGVFCKLFFYLRQYIV